MADREQEAMRSVNSQSEEQGKLIGFAERIAHGWAEQLKVASSAVAWVALKGGQRTPISAAGTGIVAQQLENGTGIAFVLGSPGVMDLLFVVRRKQATYSVNVSNNARPWDRAENHEVRHGYVGDLKRLLAAVSKYVRGGTVALP